MKVSTDACVFGALSAKAFTEINKAEGDRAQFLDIGAGTGLLSLMVAQQTTGLIDAVEIDAAAQTQAAANFEASPFNDRLSLHAADILQFIPDKLYDGIICNPPFFEDDLKSADEQVNAAKHSTTLTLSQLLATCAPILSEDGLLAVLLPYQRIVAFTEEANKFGFFLQQKILLRHTLQHTYFRGILFLSKKEGDCNNQQLVIKEKTGEYTEAFIDLLKDYYLHL